MVEDFESEFPPKIYDSHDPKASVVCDYHLWRDFEDNSVKNEVLQHQQRQEQQSQLDLESGLFSNSAYDDKADSSIFVDENSKTAAMETKENSTNSVNDSNNLSKSDFSSTGDEMSNTMKERLDESLGSYTHGALYQAVHKRSVKRSPITKEELWTTRSGKMKPVCTVTIADFSKTRYRLERRTVFSTWSHLGLLNDCDPKMNTKEELLNKLEASRAGLVSALRNTPDWSNMRWINVNGIEEDVFFAIIDEYKLNLKAVSRMSNPESSFDAQMYGDQLFCQLPILRKPKDGEVEDDKLARLCQSMMYSCGEVDPPSVDTFSTGTVKDHGWIFMPDSKTVISFFENSGEDVEEHVFFDFLRDLRLQEEMNIDASVCFENILNAFAGDLPSVVHELMRAI
ncbi:unnamed protein product [Ambrosiozyma monospora]|uniref:Unnamed protein product n=1 Tax=Ambrosiozyma monospora TaxID=43982 RepID=A0ACB5UB35_AMBMO|nr:unnamed protein product [Ambrosiozyma monospora]